MPIIIKKNNNNNAVGLRFDFLAGQIGRSDANGRHRYEAFLELRCLGAKSRKLIYT